MPLGGRLASAYGRASMNARALQMQDDQMRRQQAEDDLKQMAMMQAAGLTFNAPSETENVPQDVQATPIKGGPAMGPIRVNPVATPGAYAGTVGGQRVYRSPEYYSQKAAALALQRQKAQDAEVERRLKTAQALKAEAEARAAGQAKPERPFYDAERGAMIAPTGQVTIPRGLPPRPANPQAQYKDLSAVATIRSQYNAEPVVKSAQDMAQSIGRIREAGKNPSAAGDLALIFSYMKMLDPGSTVREGEFANAQNAAGVSDQIRNAYNKAANGERLNDRQRLDFIRQAERQAQSQHRLLLNVANRYGDIAKRAGLNPKDVVFDPFAQSGGAATGVPFPEY